MNKKTKDLIDNNPDLASYISSILEENTHIKKAIISLEKQNENLRFSLDKIHKTVFGTKSEKTKQKK
ncbi:MAG: hypothetical protein GX905_00725 [Bacteroidales bacterium]|nr:hypothetical protein [Bacteroidales bacterium]